MNGNQRSVTLRLGVIGLLLVVVVALLLAQYGGSPFSRRVASMRTSPADGALATETPATTVLVLLPTDTPTATPRPSPTPSATSLPWPVSILPDVPSPLRNAIADALATASNRYRLAENGAGTLIVSMHPAGDNATLFLVRVYVPVMRFATLREAVTTDELLALWRGTVAGGKLYLDAETQSILQALWGPQGEAATVEIIAADAIPDRLWQEPTAMAILPFERLTPRLAVLAVDGRRAVDNRLPVDPAGVPLDYPLTLRLYLSGPVAGQWPLLDALLNVLPFTNRDPHRLTTLIMTGVTAMARMTAVRMEQYSDPAYPARVIGEVLSAADITHISNEIPFVPDCVADGSENNLILCSHPSYFAALEMVGVDIIGLTGNHMADFGDEAMRYTLDFYRQKEISYYAGGRNETEATQPLLITHNGNRFAFLGANQWGPPYTWATADKPGAARYDPDALATQIRELKAGGQVDIVSVEFQWEESYQAWPLANQIEGFRAMAEAGADLVTGVQSHVPQAMEFHANGGVILYGLGNLFFDQMWSEETRQGLIARHTFYQGRHIGSELLVTILEDYVQPRWATPAERAAVLHRVFAASGW